MSNQKDDTVAPKSGKSIGTAELTWNGKVFHSSNVDHHHDDMKPGHLHADTFNFTINNSFFVSLKTGIEAGSSFSQSYEYNDPSYHTRWGLIFDGVSHIVKKGTVTGKFFNYYKEIEATIDMELESGETLTIEFNARDRSLSKSNL